MGEETQARPLERETNDNQDGYVQLVRDLLPMNAHVLLGRLQAEGIDAYISSEAIAQTNSLWRNALGGGRIFVLARQQAEAISILAVVNSGDYELDVVEDIDLRRDSARCKRLFGRIVVCVIAIVFGGLALAVIWSPSYDYFPYSITPEPVSRIIGKWVLSALVLTPAAIWLLLIEVFLKRRSRQ